MPHYRNTSGGNQPRNHYPEHPWIFVIGLLTLVIFTNLLEDNQSKHARNIQWPMFWLGLCYTIYGALTNIRCMPDMINKLTNQRKNLADRIDDYWSDISLRVLETDQSKRDELLQLSEQFRQHTHSDDGDCNTVYSLIRYISVSHIMCCRLAVMSKDDPDIWFSVRCKDISPKLYFNNETIDDFFSLRQRRTTERLLRKELKMLRERENSFSPEDITLAPEVVSHVTSDTSFEPEDRYNNATFDLIMHNGHYQLIISRLDIADWYVVTGVTFTTRINIKSYNATNISFRSCLEKATDLLNDKLKNNPENEINNLETGVRLLDLT